MQTRTRAVFENGVLRPLQPIHLVENQQVVLSIDILDADSKDDQDRASVLMSPEDWEAFCTALDAPSREIPALGRLFKKSDIFDRHGSGSE